MATVVECMSSVHEGSPEARKTRNLAGEKYKTPDFRSPYTNVPFHPLTSQYNVESEKFLVSHGLDKQMGPALWSCLVKSRGPELAGLTYYDCQPRDFLWLCKSITLLFALDSSLEPGQFLDSPEKFIRTVLVMNLVLLWNNPDDEYLLEHVKPACEYATTDEHRALVEAFYEDLAHARIQNKTKDLPDIEMPHFASAFRELWIEYCKAVPAEFVPRLARVYQEYVMSSFWETRDRRAGYTLKTFEDYVHHRRVAAAVPPCIVFSDLFIARSLKVPHLPNSLFYGSEMQSLLLAINDFVGWHNDVYSFHKEIYVTDDGHNLVKVLCEERNCASYTEAAGILLQLAQGRISDMERAYEQLKAVASPEYHLAVDRYMATCRNWVSGTHQFHLISTRYTTATTA